MGNYIFQVYGCKNHAKCQCSGFSDLLTNQPKDKKQKCCWGCYVNTNGELIEYSGCSNTESYVCSSPFVDFECASIAMIP